MLLLDEELLEEDELEDELELELEELEDELDEESDDGSTDEVSTSELSGDELDELPQLMSISQEAKRAAVVNKHKMCLIFIIGLPPFVVDA